MTDSFSLTGAGADYTYWLKSSREAEIQRKLGISDLTVTLPPEIRREMVGVREDILYVVKSEWSSWNGVENMMTYLLRSPVLDRLEKFSCDPRTPLRTRIRTRWQSSIASVTYFLYSTTLRQVSSRIKNAYDRDGSASHD